MLNKRLRTNLTRARDRARRNNWFRVRLNDGPRLGTQFDLFSDASQGHYRQALSERQESLTVEDSSEIEE